MGRPLIETWHRKFEWLGVALLTIFRLAESVALRLVA